MLSYSMPTFNTEHYENRTKLIQTSSLAVAKQKNH